MDISERIEQIRTSKNIRKADMAKVLEMDPSYYNKFEKRGDKLTIEQLEKMAGALGVGLLELLTGEPQEAATNSSKVKQLETRIAELESKLEDREFRIQIFYEQAFDICDMINAECQDQMVRCAVKNKILDINAKNDYIKYVEEEKGDEDLYMWYWYWKKSKLRFKRFLPLNLIMEQEKIGEVFEILTLERGIIPVFYAFAHYSINRDYSDYFDASIRNLFVDGKNKERTYKITNE